MASRTEVGGSSSGPLPDPRRRRALLLGGGFLVLLIAFWPTLRSFGSVWERYTYSHGYLTAAVALWLVWRERSQLLSGRPDRRASVLVLVLSLAWLAATVMDVQVVHELLFVLILLAWTGAMSGAEAVRRVLPAALVFLFAIPVWEILIPPLQALTIAVSGGVVDAVGVHAVIAGEMITIPEGTFHVEGACAGLAFFVVGLLLATLYGLLFLRTWRSRLEVAAVSVLVAVAGNWVRVATLILIGHATRMRSSLMTAHGIYGWAIFSAGFLFVFLPVARWIEKREEGQGAVPDEPSRQPVSPGLGSHKTTFGWPSVATAMAVTGPLVYFVFGALPARAPKPTGATDVPPPPWRVASGAVTRPVDWSPSFEDADGHASSIWTNGSVDVMRDEVLYRAQRQGRGVLEGSGGIAPASSILVDHALWLPGGDTWVRQAVVALPDSPLLVWYWYRVGGVDAVSPAWARVLQLWGFFRRRTDAEVVSISTPCGADDCRSAQDALRSFLGS